jgi:hypothetical protein
MWIYVIIFHYTSFKPEYHVTPIKSSNDFLYHGSKPTFTASLTGLHNLRHSCPLLSLLFLTSAFQTP